MNLNSKSGSLASAPGLKECRQCHCTKPIRCFLRKNSTGLCIICDTCRETQMKRYYGGSQFTALSVERKRDMERNEKKPPIFAPKRIRSYLPIRPAPEKVEPVEKSEPGFPRTPTPFSSDSSSPMPCLSYLNTTPVPYSKWIQVTQFCQGMSDDSIPKARLIYYSKMSIYSGFSDLDQCPLPNQPSLPGSAQSVPLDKSDEALSPLYSSCSQEYSHHVEL